MVCWVLSNAIGLVGAGIAHAVKSSSPVVAVVFAVVFLGETLTAPIAVGVVLVVAGLVVLTRSSNESNESVDFWTAVLVSLLIVVWFGATPVVRKFGLSELGAPLVPALALNFAVGFGVGVAISLYRDTGQLRAVVSGDSRWYLLVTGLCWTASTSAYFLALSLADAAVVVPIFNYSPLFTVALGLLLFEGSGSPTRATLVGAVITVCGVVLITVGRTTRRRGLPWDTPSSRQGAAPLTPPGRRPSRGDDRARSGRGGSTIRRRRGTHRGRDRP